MSQQSLQTYMPSNTSDDAANIARKQNEQRIENQKRKMNLRKRKQPKFRMLGDIYRETVILSAAIPKRQKEKCSENNKRGKTNLHRRKLQKFRMLADLYKDTKVLPAAISNNSTARACGCGQHRITEANPPSQKVFMAAIQLLRISNGVVHPKVSSKTETEEPASGAKVKIPCRLDRVSNMSTTAEYEIRSPICRVNKNPAEFRISTAKMFMRSLICDEIRSGKSDKDIYQKLEQDYGETILYAPKFDWQTAGVWLSPLIIAGAAGGIWAYGRHRQRTNVCSLIGYEPYKRDPVNPEREGSHDRDPHPTSTSWNSSFIPMVDKVAS